MASTIDHVEKTLADSYRKEIDQEENVWRSLPFFAATIAFQFTTLAQVVLRLPAHGSGAWWDAILAIALQSVCVAVALGFLAASIVPARFTYVSEEPALLDYARGLDQDAQDAIPSYSTPSLSRGSAQPGPSSRVRLGAPAPRDPGVREIPIGALAG